MSTATDRDHGGPLVAPRTGGRPDRALTRLGGRISGRRLYVPTVVIAVGAAWLGWQGWSELSEFGVARSIDASRFQLAGPVVLGFVLVVFLIEQAFPAVRRPLLARGHVVDMCYLLAYALAVVPLIVLIDSGFSTELARHATWLVIPPLPGALLLRRRVSTAR